MAQSKWSKPENCNNATSRQARHICSSLIPEPAGPPYLFQSDSRASGPAIFVPVWFPSTRIISWSESVPRPFLVVGEDVTTSKSSGRRSWPAVKTYPCRKQTMSLIRFHRDALTVTSARVQLYGFGQQGTPAQVIVLSGVPYIRSFVFFQEHMVPAVNSLAVMLSRARQTAASTTSCQAHARVSKMRIDTRLTKRRR